MQHQKPGLSSASSAPRLHPLQKLSPPGASRQPPLGERLGRRRQRPAGLGSSATRRLGVGVAQLPLHQLATVVLPLGMLVCLERSTPDPLPHLADALRVREEHLAECKRHSVLLSRLLCHGVNDGVLVAVHR